MIEAVRLPGLVDLIPAGKSSDPTYKFCIEILNSTGDIKCTLSAGQLNCRVGEWKLSPLHLCAITGRLDLAKDLLSRGARADIQCTDRWLPIHFAALRRDKEMLQLILQRLPKLANAKTVHGLDIAGIERWVLAPELRKEQEAWLLEDDGTETRLSGKQFTKLTGSTLVSHRYVPPQALFEIWKNPYYCVDRKDQQLSFQATQLSEPFQNVILRKDPLWAGTVGWDIFARKDVWAEDIACVYGGKMEEQGLDSDHSYRLDRVCALTYRGPGAMINHGFPNAVVKGVSHDSVSQSVIQVTEVTAKHERLCLNYGGKYMMLYTRPFVELRLEEMLHFFHELPPRDFQRWIDIMDRAKVWLPKLGVSTFDILYEDFETKYQYLASTPACSAYLIFNEIATAAELAKLWANPRFRKLSLMDAAPEHVGHGAVPYVFQTADEVHHLQKSHPSVPLEKLFIELCASKSVCAATGAMKIITGALAPKPSVEIFPRMRLVADSMQVLQDVSADAISDGEVTPEHVERIKACLLPLLETGEQFMVANNYVLIVQAHVPSKLEWVRKELETWLKL